MKSKSIKHPKKWSPGALRTIEKSFENGITIYQKSEEMVPRNAPKATLAANLFQVSKKAATGLRNGCNFCATWAILGAILGPAGRQGAPQIELFGTKSHQNLKK